MQRWPRDDGSQMTSYLPNSTAGGKKHSRTTVAERRLSPISRKESSHDVFPDQAFRLQRRIGRNARRKTRTKQTIGNSGNTQKSERRASRDFLSKTPPALARGGCAAS